jgi:hypothetical protein
LSFLKLHFPKKREHGNMSTVPRNQGTPYFAKWWTYEGEAGSSKKIMEENEVEWYKSHQERLSFSTQLLTFNHPFRINSGLFRTAKEVCRKVRGAALQHF